MAGAKVSPIRVGVAGWDYRDWKGVVYPKPRPRGFDPIRYLAAYLDLIEINSTFYRPPRPEVAARWAEWVEGLDDFRFTAKLWRRFTHERKKAWTIAEVRKLRDGFDPLYEAGRLEAVLIQFPWSFKNVEASREWLSDLVGAFRKYPLVVEVRHESWNQAEFYAWLGERGVGFVNIDQPLFSKSIRPSARSTSRMGYIRVHGRNYQDWWRKDAGGGALRLSLRPRGTPSLGCPCAGDRTGPDHGERRRRFQQPQQGKICRQRIGVQEADHASTGGGAADAVRRIFREPGGVRAARVAGGDGEAGREAEGRVAGTSWLRRRPSAVHGPRIRDLLRRIESH